MKKLALLLLIACAHQEQSKKPFTSPKQLEKDTVLVCHVDKDGDLECMTFEEFFGVPYKPEEPYERRKLESM